MSIRQFTDSHGVVWRAWATYPVHAASLDASYRDGWLTFQSETERRRVVPVPKDWENASDQRLELLCASAEDAPDRRSRTDMRAEGPDELAK